MPPSVRVVLKLNEKPLFTLFANYVSNRLDIPTNTHGSAVQSSHKPSSGKSSSTGAGNKFTKKLLSVQQLWKLFKDFGVVPELVRKQRLLEIAADCLESDVVKDAEASNAFECTGNYKHEKLSLPTPIR
jgi:hypothetical protein